MKSIIIDGCNVAECMYTNGLYNGVYGCINLNLNPACCKNPNCYFKQLQRVKQENEKLKRLINMNLTTFDECCVNGLIMSNNMSEVLDE